MRPRSTSGTTSKHKGSENIKIQDTRRSLSPFFLPLAWRRRRNFVSPLPFFLALATKRLPLDAALLQARDQLLILYTLVFFFDSARVVVSRLYSSLRLVWFGHDRER